MIDVKHVTILAKYIVENPKCTEKDLIKIMVSDFGLTVERAEEWLRVYISVCAEFFIIPAPMFEALKTTLFDKKNDLDAIAQKSAKVVEMRLTEMETEAEKQKRIAELEQQINDLQEQIDSIVDLEYPARASNELKQAVDCLNERNETERLGLINIKLMIETEKAELEGNGK